MKLLLLTDRMEHGGAETHIAQLALGLAREGIDVSLLSSGGTLADELERRGIPQFRLPLCTHNPFKLLSLRRKLKRLIKEEHFDILHAHARIPAFLLRGIPKKECAHIVTVHARFRSDFPLSRLSYWGEKTVAVSEDLRSYVCDRYRVPAERVRVIPNGIDCARFSPPAPDVRQESDLEDAPLRICFASRLDTDCSLIAELLCSLVPTLSTQFENLCITIAGGGNAFSSLVSLAEKINRSMQKEFLHVCGWVEDMPALLRKQDVFVGVSRAAMEAAACGCAVILGGNEGYLGILDESHYESALQSNFSARGCPPADKDRLLCDLLQLLENRSLRQSCAVAGRRLILSHCNAEKMCKDMLALYQGALHIPKVATLTVVGYFGCGNLGDDAILKGFLAELKKKAPDIRVLALTGSPRKDRRRFGISCYGRKNPLRLLWCLLRSDTLLCGGGSLLQNLTSQRSLCYYLTLLRISLMLRPTMLYACGIGPLLGKSDTDRCVRILSKCRYISLRDQDSYRLLRSLGISPKHLYVGADTALFLSPPQEGRAVAVLKENKISTEGRYLTVILRESPRERDLEGLLPTAIRLFCSRHGLFPLFLVFDRKQDKRITHRVCKRCGGKLLRFRDVSDALAIIARSEAVLSMRLHGLILATVTEIPALGICSDARDKKLISFGKESGQRVLYQNGLSAGEIVEEMELMLNERETIRSILGDSRREMRKKAEKDLENIVGMIYNEGK